MNAPATYLESISRVQLVVSLTLEVTTGPNSARAISAYCAHGRNSAQFGMTL